MKIPYKLRRPAAALACLFLLSEFLCPSVAAQNGDIHISSLSDWQSFAENCTLDSWSRDRTVILDCDLELTGTEIVPTFGGVFDGKGHTISGLSLTGSGSQQGLFRYIQEGGTVKNLKVQGTVSPAGEARAAGGLVGVNRGTVSLCGFDGRVCGKVACGGIAGINEATGRIISCTSGGSVTGEHYTGGIAGENYGSLITCTNAAQVNTQEESVSPELDGIDWADLNSTENIPACTDSGGIAGYSKGILEGCVNNGSVGYPHTGYNVGGIAGRQAGYINGCSNYGLIQGRKEVGGIAGQMEPYTQLRYEEDTLQKLLNEMDVLGDMLSGTISNTDASRHQISDRLSTIGKLTGSAREDLSGMIDCVGDFGGGVIDTVNELSARISRVLELSGPVLDNLSSFSDKLGDAITKTGQAIDTAGSASVDMDAALRELRAASSDLQSASNQMGTAMDKISAAVNTLRTALEGGGSNMETAIAEALPLFNEALTKISEASASAESGLRHLQNAVPYLENVSDIMSAALVQLRGAMDDLAQATDFMSAATNGLSQIVKELSEKPTLEFPKLDSSYYEKEDSLNQTLDSMSTELESLGSTANSAGDVLSADLQRIVAQFGVITNVLRGSLEEDPEDTERVVDVSDEDSTAITWGKVSGCFNYGSVDGDINVGGIAGAMAIEFDFDPEDDIAGQRTSALNFQYLTRAVLRDSENRGSILARRDCAGGIVGRMDLGMIISCRGLGPVESVRGEYVGGVAGASYAVIRGSWAKCVLTGSGYVGGVAGYGSDISESRAMVQIEGAEYCSGAIAGQAEGSLSGNFFVGDGMGGVDGISYSEKAEPVSYSVLVGLEGVPAEFSAFKLSFIADGETVSTINFKYGESIDSGKFPPVPEKEGYYGRWEEFDSTDMRFDTVVNAVYTPWVTVLADATNTVMAEGVFAPGSGLVLSESMAQPPVLAEGEELKGVWHVELTEPGEDFTALRLKCPEDLKRPCVKALSADGTWEEIPFSRDGSYLVAELTGSSADICITETPVSSAVWIAVGCIAGAAVLIAGIALTVRKVKKRRPKGKHEAAGRAHLKSGKR